MGAAQESAGRDGRPNIVLIVSDDHGYADRGATGIDPAVSTPALDRLAREGVECTSAYVTAPICSPSRAAIISGRYQARWGVSWFGDASFGYEYDTIAEQLQTLGYRTGYFGKVHYGTEDVGDRACPPHHGFEESYYGLAGQSQGRLNYLVHSAAAREGYGAEGWRMGAQPMLEGDDAVELNGFLTDEFGRRARDFVDRHVDEPFFLTLAFNAVHNFCWQLPPEELARRGLPGFEDWSGDDPIDFADWYDGVITPNLEHGRDYYLAQLELMDRQIGLLLDRLDEHGLTEDTLVVYLTDNGGSTCNYGDNAPLRGTKYTLWEGGIRVPLLLRWAGGGIPAGIRHEGLVSSLDLYPSLLTATGAAELPDDLDGVDLLPALRGATAAIERELYWDCGFQWAVRSGRWKLAEVVADSIGVVGIRSVEHTDPGAGIRLYDVEADPGESVELSGEQPEVVAGLTALHDDWLARTPLAGRDRRMAGLDPGDPGYPTTPPTTEEQL